MKKFNFNMVEIALAMVVIALGISGILGLFSVGVNAKKAAINENNIADAAEYILGTYKAVILNKIYEADPADAVAAKKVLKTALDLENKPADKYVDDTNWEPGTENIKKFSISSVDTNIYKSDNTMSDKTVPQVFCYMPTRTVDGAIIPDCQIVGRVWAENIPFHYRDWQSDAVKCNYSGDSVVDDGDFYDNGYAMRVYLELSWPAAKKYAEREKRIFVMDIANPLKELAYD